MANSLKGEVPLILEDGRTLTLVLDMEALVEAESAYGKPMQKMMADAAAGFVGASRALLYGALRAKHPAFTLRDASGVFMSDGEAVGEALSKAAELAFPDAKEGKQPGNPPKARLGKTSGGNGAKQG